jgi:hypothetical protein
MIMLLYVHEVALANYYLNISFSLAGRPQSNQELCHEQGYITSWSVRVYGIFCRRLLL